MLLRVHLCGSIFLVISSFASLCLGAPAVRQVVVVQTDDWSANHGTGYRFIGHPGSWRQVGPSFDVTVGRTGLGWGLGLHEQAVSDGPIKQEGDGRAPAGHFSLTSAFGRGKRGFKYPYEVLKPGRVCVDDADDEAYNTFQTTPYSQVSWSSAEPLFEISVYDLGVVVAHNVSPTFPGRGSCIFLHRWLPIGAPTNGCTAMSQAHLKALVEWLDPHLAPSLVQMPRRQYEVFRRSLGFPVLP